ncbi:MAG: 3-deoxy-manno-octulosonate cytidylyltransferase [Acidobacteria bacterium]|nr:3-deoxy-manno-octulosonate cytidylyltransferase [Acidobacteriota bacterium]
MSSVEPSCRIVGVIPARYDSERLPGKVLRPIAGKAMVHLVYERARACPLLSELWVAADSESVRGYCEQHGIPVRMTARHHRSGTERILEVMETVPADVYVNLQADEPMLNANHVRLLVEPFLADPRIQITTLRTPLKAAEAQNPHVVKVVTGLRGQALYFSRAPIPYHRDPAAAPAFSKHLGLYAYSREALERYRTLLPSPLEQAERLEQLRFLENGIPIQVAEAAEDTIGVDTEEDWLAVRKYFAAGATGR